MSWCVIDLYVTKTNDQFNDSQHDYRVNLDEQITRQTALTFPNVKEFKIDFQHKNYSALREVWKSYESLEKSEISRTILANLFL